MHAVEGVSLSLDEGEVLGIVGESGSGKSVTHAGADGPGGVSRPRARRADCASPATTCSTLSPRERRRLTGKDVAMIFQDPTTSLNPCFTDRLSARRDAAAAPRPGRPAPQRKRAIELLEQVGIPAPASRLKDFPHQMSGGMNQRVMIAMAIACNPRLLIADEPTTALDVTIQAQILDLLRNLQKERGMALVLITHNMGVVAEMAQRVAVMYAGQVVEERSAARSCSPRRSTPTPQRCWPRCPSAATASARLATIPGMVPGLLDRPGRLPVRAALRLCRPTIAAPSARRCATGRAAWCAATTRWATPMPCDGAGRRSASCTTTHGGTDAPQRSTPVVEATRPAAGLHASAAACFARRRSCRRWAASRSRIEAGRTLAVVGESGCGKSTLARMVSLIEKPTTGALRLGGVDAVQHRQRAERRRLRRAVQLVFQNPYRLAQPAQEDRRHPRSAAGDQHRR